MKDLLLYITLVLIVSLVIPRLKLSQLKLMNTLVMRILFVTLIVITAIYYDQLVALLLLVIFVSLVYNLNCYKMKKTFDVSLEVMHEKHKKENPSPDFEEIDTSLIYYPNDTMGKNDISY